MPIHTRAYVGTLVGYVYSLGQFLLAGIAYAVPHWRHLQLLVSVPYFVAFIYSWYVGSGVESNAQRLQGYKRQAISQNRAQTSQRIHQARKLSLSQTLLLNRL